MKDSRFEEIRESLYKELLRANLHYKIFWVLNTAPEDIANIRNVYLSFFVLTMKSHHDRFCLAVHNVVECDPDTANFQKIFNYIKSNKKIQNVFDLKEIEVMEATIKSHTSLIKRIAIARDQYIAHNQLKKKHLAEQTTYKYEEGKRLLTDLNKILEEVSKRYDRMGYWKDNDDLLDVSPSLNVEEMLRNLTEYRKEQITRITKGAKS
jgi:hypothetical protein